MSATVHQPNGNYSPKGSHLSLVVLINNVYYIADVGFGDLPLQALPITSIEATQTVFEKTGQFRAILKPLRRIFFKTGRNNVGNTL